MKVYISADIEGITGITSWDEANPEKPDYKQFQEQMTKEVIAACEGALNAGAKEIYVKDAHWHGRNLIASRLPEEVILVRGWSGHPLLMVQELDNSFDALIFTGYHSAGGMGTNPLAHTLTSGIDTVKINGELVSEFHLHSYAAALFEVPAVFISGDAGICRVAKNFNKQIKTVTVSRGIGDSTISFHPSIAMNKIREGVEAALNRDLSSCKIELPENFELKVRFKEHKRAYKASFYPGAKLADAKSITYQNSDFMEILRILLFI